MKFSNSYFLLIILVVLGNVTYGQNKNILIDRSFWKQQPSVEEVEKKIKEGHSPTAMTSSNFDATVYAILENNSLETIKYLLTQGNAVDKITHDGRTYLMWAALRGNIEVMKYLVDEGAKLDIVDQHGYSLLMFPASNGQPNTMMYDYMQNELGIDILEEKDRNGRNALLACASRIKDFELVDYFISKGLDINSVDANGNGMFHYAAQTGDKKVIKKLVADYKVNAGLNENTNENAILFATRRNGPSLSFFQYLEKEFDLDPAIVSKKGQNALHSLVTRTKDLETIRYFVEKGADPNQQDDKGNSALINASARGSKEVIEYLISKTSDINVTNKDGLSGLTRAVKYNSLEVAKLLKDSGADIEVVDRKGNNLGYHLVDAFNRDVDAFKQKSEYLVGLGLDMNSKQSEGTTLVHNAIKKSDIELLKVLLSYGIDINAKDENGDTALHKAALQSQDEKMLKYLVKAGADLGINTAFDESAYDLAKSNEMLADTNIEFLKAEGK